MTPYDTLLDRFSPGLRPLNPDVYHTVFHRVESREWERLEFLGDAVVSLIAAHSAFVRYPQFSEGQLSRYRVQMVKGTTLASMCRFICLGSLLPDTVVVDSKLEEDLLECFLGALYLDHSLPHAMQWFLNMSDAYYAVYGSPNIDRLRSLCRTMQIQTLPTGGGAFTAFVHVHGETIAAETALNKRDAEEAAAGAALAYMGVDA